MGSKANNTWDLEKRATDFAKEVIRLCQQLPKNSMNDRLELIIEANPNQGEICKKLIQEASELRNIFSAIINKTK